MRERTEEEKEWGFLRETTEAAVKAGRDKDTGVCRTGLDEYLSVLFPEVNDWIHDEDFVVENEKRRGKKPRPDYRSEQLKMIVEFDGVQHYQKPNNIEKDMRHTKYYEDHGYTVVRIPYFIQLTNKAVKELFGIEVSEPLFDESVPSIGASGRNAPAFLCHQGIIRMAQDFSRHPEQYKVNMDYMKQIPQESQYLVEYELLEKEYESLLNESK